MTGAGGDRGPGRRRFLQGSLAGLATAGCNPPLAPLPGALASAGLHARGHRWEVPFVPGGPRRRADVVVVGAGVAGLSAAWRLAGRGLTVRVLELWDAPGGTALAGAGSRGPFPWGAHYLTLPNPEARHMRRLLRELGVITGEDGDGRPLYDPAALCLAPEERLWEGGTWIEGLWPAGHARPEDRRQREAWEELVRRWTARVGSDGLPAFSIPLAGSSADPALRSLAEVSFADWLDGQGLTAPALRWWLEYATRDDYGTTLADTSAWAGLHYHCARRPDPGDARDLGTHVLTWPAGNGWIVGELVSRIGVPVEVGATVRIIEADEAGVRVWGEAPSGVFGIDAAAVILAVPTRVAARLAGRSLDAPDHAPWRVAQLQVSRLPSARGVPTAWDSVVFPSASLGYITSTHQLGAYGGAGVLTWYEPLTGDPAARRRELLDEDWGGLRDRVLDDLGPSHPDLLDCLERLDGWHWGHGTTRPVPGLHRPGRLESLWRPHPRVSLAHTDLSGVSLFEEASWHGVRAAEEALEVLGREEASWR